MLTFQLLKNHAGMLLCGDYESLGELYKVIHDVNEASCVIHDKEGVFLGLAYDVRKAYTGQRRIIKPSKDFKVNGERYGVEILWPILLAQSRMLRVALGYFDSTKRQQSMAFLLEALIEEAVRKDFDNKAEVIIDHWLRINPSNPWVEEKLDSRAIQYSLWNKKDRKEKLVGLLASLDPMYPMNYKYWTGQDGNIVNLEHRHYHRSNLVDPEELDALEGIEWPEIDW